MTKKKLIEVVIYLCKQCKCYMSIPYTTMASKRKWIECRSCGKEIVVKTIDKMV